MATFQHDYDPYKIRGIYSATALQHNPNKVRLPAITVEIRFYLPHVFDGTIDFHNAVRFLLNMNDNDVVLPTEVLNDITYNDTNGGNRVLKHVFHPNSITIQENIVPLCKQRNWIYDTFNTKSSDGSRRCRPFPS